MAALQFEHILPTFQALNNQNKLQLNEATSNYGTDSQGWNVKLCGQVNAYILPL